MAKRVLGEDPFEAGKEPAASGKKSRTRPPPKPASKARSGGKGSRASVAPPAPAEAGQSAVEPTLETPVEPEVTEPVAATLEDAVAAEVLEEATAVLAEAAEVLEHSAPQEPTELSELPESASATEVDAPVPLPPPARLPTQVEVRVETGDEEPAAAEADAPPTQSDAESAPLVEAAPQGNLDDRIRDVEAQLDALLAAARASGGEAEALVAQLKDKLQGATSEHAAARPPATVANSEAELVAQELQRSDYFVRQWGRSALRDRSAQSEEFGRDEAFTQKLLPLLDFLYDRWWRVEVRGLENVPSEGGVILCGNHSGALPWDGVMLATALRREHPAKRELRWLADDFAFHAPFVGVWLNRLGAVRACQENAERLLARQACVGVFPEGVKGVSKHYRERYRLQRFGRGGHVKLALRTRTPIVPVCIVGAEETYPMFATLGPLARLLGVPYLPVTPLFPALGALGLVPLPTKWRIEFLEPLKVDGYSEGAYDDEVLVGRLNEKLRATLQDAVDRGVRARRSVFRG